MQNEKRKMQNAKCKTEHEFHQRKTPAIFWDSGGWNLNIALSRIRYSLFPIRGSRHLKYLLFPRSLLHQAGW
jgi:hypothetical protein